MNKEDIKKIGEIIGSYFYSPFEGMSEKEYEKWVDKNIDYVYEVEEEENDCYGAAKSDSLFIICIKGNEYVADVPWNKFFSLKEGVPDLVPAKGQPEGWYEYLGGWYEF